MTQRHYIALVDGCHAYVKVHNDAVKIPPYQPFGTDKITYFQVSQEIAEEWVTEGDYEEISPGFWEKREEKSDSREV